MFYVVAIASCHGIELQRKAARTAEWTLADLYSSLSISDEYEVIDIKISSDGKTEWVSVELLQPTELCVIFQKNHVLFRVAWSGIASFPGSCAWAEKKEPGTHCLRMLSSPRISGNLEISVKCAPLH